MKTVFITASGTEIGKTFVTQALIHQLRSQNQGVRALKPILTGLDKTDDIYNDAELLLKSLSVNICPENISRISPWRFKQPCSPDLAATLEGTSISFKELLACCKKHDNSDTLLIEGIGGMMVPLDKTHTVLDWIIALRAPVLLIVGSYLGTLSHTLTALGMLKANLITVAGIVVNESLTQPIPAQETANIISRFSHNIPITVLQRVNKQVDAPDLLPLIKHYL